MKTRSEYIALSEDYLEGGMSADEPNGVTYHHQRALIYATLALSVPPESSPDPTAEELAAALGREMAKTAELSKQVKDLRDAADAALRWFEVQAYYNRPADIVSNLRATISNAMKGAGK